MRRCLAVCLSLALIAALALATLPWWLGPVLHSGARRYGVTFQSYERLGYGRFALTDVVFAQPDVRVQVGRLEADTPVLLAIRHWRHSAREIKISSWRVDVLEAPPTPESTRPHPHGAAATEALIARIARALESWVPRAQLGAGLVSWPGDRIALGGALLTPRRLEVRPLKFKGLQADANFVFTPDNKIHAELHNRGTPGWSARAEWWRRDMHAEIFCWNQKADAAVQWIENGWKFDTGELHAHDWNIPAEELRLDKVFQTIVATVDAAWREDRYSAAIDAHLEPPPKGKSPPLITKLRASGDFHSVRVEELVVHIPGIEVQLSAPWEVDAHHPEAAKASQLKFTADLAQQKFFAAQGRISGQALLVPAGFTWPKISAEFSAVGLKRGEFALAAANGRAELQWPELRVDDVTLQFNEGGELQALGVWNFSTQALAGGKIGGIIRPALLAPWLPALVKFESINLAIAASGTWPALHHSGNVAVSKIALLNVPPFAAAVSWTGEGPAVKISSLGVSAGASRMVAGGEVNGATARLERLEWEIARGRKLTLMAPVAVHWRPPFSVGPLDLQGGDTEIKMDFRAGDVGQADISLGNFSPEWLQDFYPAAGANWRVDHFDLHGKWDHGPWDFRATGNFGLALAEQRTAGIEISLHGEPNGLTVEKLHVAEAGVPIVDVTGKLPLSIETLHDLHFGFPADQPLELHAKTSDNAEFWQRVKNLTGLELEAPDLTAEVHGTWNEPTGTVHAKAARIALTRVKPGFAMPAITALEADLRATRRQLAIDKLNVQLDGQAILVTGDLPLKVEQWELFRQQPWKFFQGAGHVRIQIPDADVAPLARYFPGSLAPSGKIRADLEIKAGGQATGGLQLGGVAVRSFGPFGILQDIQLETRFEGRTARIVNASARAGGQEMKLTGDVGLPFDQPLRLDLALNGTNIPIIRETGLLLRADVALKLVTNARHVPEISGNVNLRDSMFLSDVRAFLPSGGGGGPRRRPPYFSVESPLLSDWRLAVSVQGQHFLRLRSTIFVGLASARLYLDGTLGQPHATGEVAVDSGDVLLPFATFQVQQGSVRLTDADPFNLALSVTGTSRRYGYDLRMDVDGTVAKPSVVFSSSPPLEARQVLLMVTAGDVPNDTITYGTTQRVARLGTYLGQSLLTSFGGDAGKADRLTITTGESVSLQGRETYDIEYRLNKRYSLVGEYDEFDDYNAGVKYRLGKVDPDPVYLPKVTPAPAAPTPDDATLH